MARTMSWTYRGADLHGGTASSRCFDNLVDQRGQTVAEKVRDAAVGWMPKLRAEDPGRRGVKRFDVIVEAFLCAAGVPEADVPRLAAQYRSGSSATVDLSRYGRPLD